MRTTAVYGTAMVVLATVVNLLRGISPLGQEVLSLQAWQSTYVVCVISFVGCRSSTGPRVRVCRVLFR